MAIVDGRAMTSPVLSPAELVTITARQRRSAQRRALDRLGIPYRMDGRRIVVGRAAVDAALAGKDVPAEAPAEDYDVDLGAVRKWGRRGEDARDAGP